MKKARPTKIYLGHKLQAKNTTKTMFTKLCELASFMCTSVILVVGYLRLIQGRLSAVRWRDGARIRHHVQLGSTLAARTQTQRPRVPAIHYRRAWKLHAVRPRVRPPRRSAHAHAHNAPVASDAASNVNPMNTVRSKR